MEARIVEKLRKILAMTSSPVEAEAALAAAKLQELLTAYNLDIADLEKKGATSPGIREAGHDLGKAAFKWKLDLAEAIAEFYYCHPLVNRTTKSVAFVGRPDNVESLTMLYGWVIDQIKRIATTERRKHYDETGQHIDPLRWQLGFGEGAVDRLHTRLTEMRARQQEDAAEATSLALVVLRDDRRAEISDYLERTLGYRIDGRETQVDRARREKREAEEARLAQLKATDLEAFYRECPWERPKSPEQQALEAAEWDRTVRKWAKQEERNRRRRESYIPTGGSREKRTDWAKEEQAGTARKSGHRSADRINLSPFLSTGAKKPKGELE